LKARERVLSAVNHAVTDKVPRGEIVIDDAVVRDFFSCNEVDFERRYEFIRCLGLDLICLPFRFSMNAGDRSLPHLDDVEWEDIDRWVSQTDLFVFITLEGCYAWGSRLLGFDRFFFTVGREGSDLDDLILSVERLNLELAERAAARGAMGALIADDIAHNRGLMVHPKKLRTHFFPSLQRLVAGISAINIPVFFHSDGNLNEVLHDIVNAGFDGLQGIESAAGMDIGLIKRTYGERLCLWGNLDPRYLVLPCPKEELFEQVDLIAGSAAYGGGFILGTSSGLFKGVRPENLRAIYGAKE
jgi:uroporphyrinogen decarboxylase